MSFAVAALLLLRAYAGAQYLQPQTASRDAALVPARGIPPASARHQREAETSFLSGARHLEQRRYAEAEQDFARAVTLDPAKGEYLASLAIAREHRVTDLLQKASAARPGNPHAADQLIDQARALDSTNPRVLQHTLGQERASAPSHDVRLAGPLVLKPNATKHSYHERGDLRALASTIARDYGLTAAFDPDLRQATVRIDLDGATYPEAMRTLALLTNTIAVPVDEHTFLVATNSQENRQRYDRMVQESFFLPGVAANDLKDFVSIAQNILDIRQVSVEPTSGNIVLRGPADRVEAVERIYDDLQKGTSDVLLDVKLYSVDKQRVRDIGVALPTSVSAFSLSSQAQSIVSANSSLVSQLISSGLIPSSASTLQIAEYLVFAAGVGGSSLLSNSFAIFGGGATTGALSAGPLTINLALNQSEARALDDVQLRITDRVSATFKSGTRYPIQTSLYSNLSTPTSSSLASTTINGVSLSSLLASYLGTSTAGTAVIPQVQYEDLGFTLTATPRILRTADVGLKLEVKVSSLAGGAINGLPILDSRQFSSDLTVHDGETVMMISNTTESETAAVSGIPELSELPGFQSTTDRNSTKITGDLVLLITPHIVRRAHVAATGPYIPLTSRPGED